MKRIYSSCSAFLAAAWLGSVLLAPPAVAAPSGLDRSFGQAGHIFTPGLAAPRLAIDPAGRLLVASGDRKSLLVTRFRPSGALDRGFGTGGTGEVSLADLVRPEESAEEVEGTDIFPAGAIAVQDDGGILVSGAGVSRLGPNGSEDEEFARRRRYPNSPPRIKAGMLVNAILPRGQKFLLAGDSGKGVVSRYLPDGSLDPSFGPAENGGRIKLPPKPPNRTRYYLKAGFTDIEPGPRGTIYAAGFDNGALLLVHLLRNGHLDPSFAGGGIVEANPSSERACACFTGGYLARDRHGRLLVAGSLEALNGDSLHRQGVVARYLPDGHLDRSFGDGGFARVSANSATYVNGIALEPDGRIVLAGSSATAHFAANDGRTSFTLIRLLSSGRRDRTFFGDGIFKSSFGGSGGEAIDPIVDESGRLVVAGAVYPRGPRLDIAVRGLVVRFH